MDTYTSENYSKVFENEKISDIHFYGINFTGLDFGGKIFNDCVFEKCNLSNIDVRATTFNTVEFKNSKLMGVKFTDISEFLSNFNFHDCKILFCSFYGLNIKNTIFNDCEIKETDFSNVNLENVGFDYCDLERSVFTNCNLKKANFIGSYNFSINPSLNRLNKTKFSRENCIGLLRELDIIIE